MRLSEFVIYCSQRVEKLYKLFAQLGPKFKTDALHRFGRMQVTLTGKRTERTLVQWFLFCAVEGR